jgi:hypothetical protein
MAGALPMDNDDDWRAIFEHWPADLPRQGILTTAQDSFGFSDFLVSRGLLLVERDRPDAVGSRKVMLSYRSILSLKLSDPGPISRYQSLGFGSAG